MSERQTETTAGMIWFGDRLKAFVTESLRIEGIYRDPTEAEIRATEDFLKAELTVDAVVALQAVLAPGKPLRDRKGMDVRVGRHVAPGGSPFMRDQLSHVLDWADPWGIHVEFEKLHPFMDGNGRTGRAIWASAMLFHGEDPFALSFLHRFYYQTLEHADAKP